MDIGPERRIRFDDELIEKIRAPEFDTKSFEWLTIRGRHSTFPIKRCPILAKKLGISLEEI